MKIALIGDIHGNLYALDAVLESCKHEKVDEYVFLGDYVMDGPYSNEVLDKIKSISSNIIAGNKERLIVNYSTDTIDYKQMAIAHWTYKKLRPDNIKFISNMPNELELNIMDKKIYFSHYPTYHFKHENGVYDIVNIEKTFEYMTHDIQIYAHTHRPLEAKRFDKYIICPGSCGLPIIGDYKASYGILEVNKNKVEYKHFIVDYNISDYLSSLANTGIADDCKIWTKYYMKTVASGRNYSIDFLLFARKLMRKHNRNNKNLVDNDIWELADSLYDKTL